MANIILIGFMGAGKTSLGRATARKLKIPFLDTDKMIVEREGMTINEIFASKGEAYFRSLETQVITELQKEEGGFVLAVGGGLPLREENRPLLRKLGQVIYLKTDPAVLAKRLEADTTRPILRQGEGTVEEKVRRILKEREPKYMDAADIVVNNDGRSFYAITRKLATIYKKGGADMIRHEETKYREHMREGRGTVTIHDVLTKEDLNGHGRLYARIVIPAGASIGWHIHEGETEPFYILKGEGTFIDNDHVAHIVHPGDVCTIEAGQGHSMENNSDEDLEMMALIYYV